MAFTDEDKLWLQQLIETSSAGLESRFKEFVKASIAGLEPRFKEIDERFISLEEKMSDKIEKVETNLLTAFHKWASPAEARDRARAEAIYSLDVQVAALAERVRALEERQRN